MIPRLFCTGDDMESVTDYFGSLVFDDKVMRSMLSADIYRSLRKTINQGNPLNPDVANAVAQAENLTRHRFRQAVSGQLSRQEDIPHGIVHHQPL